MKTKTPSFAIGDRVAYSVQFLRSIGASHGDIAFLRGIVTSVRPIPGGSVFVSVDWGDGNEDYPHTIGAGSLAIVGANRRFANVD